MNERISLARRARSIRRQLRRGAAGRTAADIVRRTVVRVASTQEGLVTLEQIAGAHGTPLARRGLAALTRLEEVHRVLPGVWVHIAGRASIAGDPDLEAQAQWLRLEPHRAARERAAYAKRSDAPIAVIGGGAAYRRWGFSATTWSTEMPVPLSPAGRIASQDVTWFGVFPFLGVEATLAGSYGFSGDIDDTAADLADAIWRLHPVNRDRLRTLLLSEARRNGWVTTEREQDRLWNELLRRTAQWRPIPVGGTGDTWARNREALDAMLARYRSTQTPDKRAHLWAGVIDDFRRTEPGQEQEPRPDDEPMR